MEDWAISLLAAYMLNITYLMHQPISHLYVSIYTHMLIDINYKYIIHAIFTSDITLNAHISCAPLQHLLFTVLELGSRGWQWGEDLTAFCNSYKALLPGTVPAFPPVLLLLINSHKRGSQTQRSSKSPYQDRTQLWNSNSGKIHWNIVSTSVKELFTTKWKGKKNN